MARSLSWDDMSPEQKIRFVRKMDLIPDGIGWGLSHTVTNQRPRNQKELNLEPIAEKQKANKMHNVTKGLGLGMGAHHMVLHQSTRNKKKLNLGPITEKQKAKKMHDITKGLGIGAGANSMVLHQSTRNGKNRGHGDLTLDQAYDLTAELLIRQQGRCWITGNQLEINGYCDSTRSYSIDRLDDSKGYSVENCRAVCLWVNTATSRYPKPDQKIQLWRGFQSIRLTICQCTTTDFYDYYTDPVCLESAITLKGQKKVMKDRIPTWLTYFDLPVIVPFSELTDQAVLELLG